MADKIKLFELDIDIDKLVDNTGKTYREMKKLTEEQKVLTRTSKTLKEQIDAQNKAMKESEKAGNTKAYNEQKIVLGELEKQYEDTTRAIAKNQSELKVARKEYNMGLKMVDAYGDKKRKEMAIIRQTDGSIDQLSAALSKNRAVYRSLSKDERENSEVGGKLLKLIQEQDKEYKRLQVGMGNTNVMVGDYKESIKAAFKEMNFFNKGLQDLVSHVPIVGGLLGQLVGQLGEYITMQKTAAASTEGTGKSLKLFKVALISTGIGAIVVLIGTLVAAFLSTQKGIDKVNRVLKPLGVILQRFWGILQKLGTAMVDTFTHPKEAIAGLWKAIKTNLINHVTGMIDTFKYVGKAINAALHLDFKGLKENAAKVGESALQAATGVDNLTGKLKNAAKETGKFLSDSWKTGQDLADLTVKIEETENKMIVKRSMLNAEYEKQKEIAQDVNKTEAERRAAAQKAIDIQNQLLEDEQALLDMKIKKKRAELALNDTDREAQKELNELIAKRTDFEAQAARKRVSAMNLEKTIDTQIRTKQVAAAKKAVDLAMKESKAKLAIYVAENKDKAKTLNEQLKYEQTVHDKKVKLLEQELKAKKITQEEFDLQMLQEKNRFLQKQEDLTLQHAQKELEIYIEENKSKIDSDKALTVEAVNEEENRLYAIYNKRKDIIEKQHEEGLIDDQDYKLQMLQLDHNYLQQKQQLEDDYREQRKEAEQTDWENTFQTKQIQGENEFTLRKEQLDRQYRAEIAAAKKTGASIAIIKKKYAAYDQKLTADVEKFKRDQIWVTVGMIGNLLGRQSIVGKAFAIAEIINSTVMNATKAFETAAVLASNPLTAPLAANAYIQGGIIIATGAAQVAKTVLPEKDQGFLKNMGKAEQGLMIDIGGNRHSSGGTKFYGEDGTYFEAEKDEKLFVLNRLASKVLGPSLSRLNVLTGGRPLWQPSGYLAAGGAVARSISASPATSVKVEGMTLNYDLLAEKVSAKNAERIGEKLKDLPRPVTDVKDIIREVNNYNEIVNGANI